MSQVTAQATDPVVAREWLSQGRERRPVGWDRLPPAKAAQEVTKDPAEQLGGCRGSPRPTNRHKASLPAGLFPAACGWDEVGDGEGSGSGPYTGLAGGHCKHGARPAGARGAGSR